MFAAHRLTLSAGGDQLAKWEKLNATKKDKKRTACPPAHCTLD
jgi:hypothetical protein